MIERPVPGEGCNVNRYSFTPYSDDGLLLDGPDLQEEIGAWEGGIRLEVGPLVAILHWRDEEDRLGGCPWTWEIVWPDDDECDGRAKQLLGWKVCLEWSKEPGPSLVVETPEPVTVEYQRLSEWRKERDRLASEAAREAEKARLDREVARLQAQRGKLR